MGFLQPMLLLRTYPPETSGACQLLPDAGTSLAFSETILGQPNYSLADAGRLWQSEVQAAKNEGCAMNNSSNSSGRRAQTQLPTLVVLFLALGFGAGIFAIGGAPARALRKRRRSRRRAPAQTSGLSDATKSVLKRLEQSRLKFAIIPFSIRPWALPIH